MNNIDEDIKIVKEKLEIIESLCTDNCINKSFVIEPFKYAISNVLTQLNTNKYDINNYEERITSLKSELETYKKIAEKLAEILSDYKYEKIICMKTDCEHIEIQNGGKCIGDKECIIEWARKEVENGTKNKK